MAVQHAVVPLHGSLAQGIGAGGGECTPLGASIMWPILNLQVPPAELALFLGTIFHIYGCSSRFLRLAARPFGVVTLRGDEARGIVRPLVHIDD